MVVIKGPWHGQYLIFIFIENIMIKVSLPSIFFFSFFLFFISFVYFLAFYQNFRFPAIAMGSLIAFSAMAFASTIVSRFFFFFQFEDFYLRATGSSSTFSFLGPNPSSSSSEDSSSSSEGGGVALSLYWKI